MSEKEDKEERAVIRRVALDILPSNYLDYKTYLFAVYSESKKGIGSFSYTKFAELLGFGATNIIHQFIKGRRPLTQKSGQKILIGLGVVGLERKYFLTLIDYGNAKDGTSRETAMAKLLDLKNKALPSDFDKDCLEYYSKWYHPVVRELVGLKSFKNDPTWISSRLTPAIKSAQASRSLELLKRLKLIQTDETGEKLMQSEQRVTTGHRVKNMALVQYHKQMIDIAKESLSGIKGKRRDVSALTISVDQATSEKIKSMIHEFQLSVLEVAEQCPDPEHIYHVNIQFFPFTKDLKD